MSSAQIHLPGLTSRQKLVLRLVVREYTRSATPVSSKVLVDQYGLKVSSATIRNELARLEELGLLTHPHTSAGRVPTDAGYRYFIEYLMPERELPLTERRRISHQFHQLGLELDQWLQLSAAILADTVRNAAVVTAPRGPQVRFKHLELISTYGNSVLLVLVLQNGVVRQHGLVTRQPVSQEALSQVSDRLSALCRGLQAHEIESLTDELTAFDREVLQLVAACMRDLDRAASVEAYREGLRHLLSQPEFADSTAVSRAMSLLESDWLAASILPQVTATNGVTVLLGHGGEGANVGEYGLVLSRYGVQQELVGALGVLGPVRMNYETVIPAVRYMASLLSELIWGLFGPGEVDGLDLEGKAGQGKGEVASNG
ncbi:MAG: heat-inducible transcription repressor HrcA [Anaerolineae bacterium]|nr:heat-inducible transcription repressor HrcA [Anaerolineae bacterium]